MKKRYLIIALVALVAFVSPIIVNAEIIGDITCTPVPEWDLLGFGYNCEGPNFGLTWYPSIDMARTDFMPPKEESYVAPDTYIYVDGAATETFTP